MSKSVHNAHKEFASILIGSTDNVITRLESAGKFSGITGSGDLKSKMKDLKVGRGGVVTGETDVGGFGSRPSFNPGSDFGTIKSGSYSDILRGSSRKTEVQSERYAKRAHQNHKHRSHRPHMDEATVAKYTRSNPKRHGGTQVAKAAKQEKAGPSVTLTYLSDLRPRIAVVIKNREQAFRALRHREIGTHTLVSYGEDAGAQMLLNRRGLSRLFSRG